jgi:hypothetical protein
LFLRQEGPAVKPFALFVWLSTTSHQYFSVKTNQPPAISQQYFSLRKNQHQQPAERTGGLLLIRSNANN